MKNENKIKKFVSNSFVVSVMNKISDFFYDKIITSKTSEAFTSYSAVERKSRESFFVKIFNSVRPSKKTVLKYKNKVSDKIESSAFYLWYKKVISMILSTRTKSYGTFMLVYGFLSSISALFSETVIYKEQFNVSVITQGVVTIILSLPLLFSRDSLRDALVKGRITNKILTFLDLKLEASAKTDFQENLVIPLVLSLIFGIFSFALKPIYLLLLLIALFTVSFVLCKPEYGVLFIIILLPFLPTMVLALSIVFIFLAYILKVIRGKRSFKMEPLDFAILLFSMFLFFGGAFSVTPTSSFPPVCVFLCFILSYYLIVNLVKTTKFVKEILSCSLISLTICSLYGIYQNFFAAPDTTWTDEDMFSEIETRVVSTFENPNVFGEYLIMMIPISIALVVVAKSIRLKTATAISLCFVVASLIYTWSRGAWLGCIVSLIVLFIIINKRAISFYLFGLLALPIALPFLPSSISERFLSIGNMTDSSTSYRVFIWEATVNMIKDYLFSGIGVGTTAFQTIYTEYALAGIETAPHSHNLYLQIVVELGIFGFLSFLAVIVLFFMKSFSFIRKSSSVYHKLVVGGICCGILAFLAQGITDYVWYNYRVFGLFWMLMGLCVACVKADESENLENNEIL